MLDLFLASGLSAQCLSNQVCRLEYPLLPSNTSFFLYLGFLMVLVVFFYGVYRKFSIYKIGRKEVRENLPRVLKNWKKISTVGFGQNKILQTRFGGFMHSWMFYGITVLIIGTILVGIDYDILRPNGIILLQGDFYLGYKVALDLFGLAFTIGIALALVRRITFRPFFLIEDRGDRFILAGLLYMGLSGFVQEGLRLALIPPAWSWFSPIGSIFSSLFASMGAGPQVPNLSQWVALYQSLWWIHAAVAFVLIAAIPFTKFFHVPNSLINMGLYEQKPMGKMSTPFNLVEILKQSDADQSALPDLKIGIATTSDLNWSQRAMLDSCTNCGRCESACPANAAGRDLSPRAVVQDLKRQFYFDSNPRSLARGEEPSLIETGIVRPGEMYSCVMCAACVYECPVMINHLDFISDLRRTLVTQSKLDAKQTTLLSNLATHQNPYGLSSSSRADWAKELDIKLLSENPDAEYLFWVGCVSSFDQRAQSIAKSLVRIFKHAGVSFAILGNEESCNGDPARRLGEEGRYQELAIQNIEKMNSYKVRKIITSCPHCFNTIRNEYPEFGGKYEVLHHSQAISDLISAGKIKINQSKINEISVTLHDACYAARMNSIFEEPRNVLNAARSDMKEMHRCKEKTFCCGAGGSNYWYNVPQQRTITSIRTEEAANTGASTLATECPFCLSMFEDSTRVTGTKMEVKDIAEIISAELDSTSN